MDLYLFIWYLFCYVHVLSFVRPAPSQLRHWKWDSLISPFLKHVKHCCCPNFQKYLAFPLLFALFGPNRILGGCPEEANFCPKHKSKMYCVYCSFTIFTILLTIAHWQVGSCFYGFFPFIQTCAEIFPLLVDFARENFPFRPSHSNSPSWGWQVCTVTESDTNH